MLTRILLITSFVLATAGGIGFGWTLHDWYFRKHPFKTLRAEKIEISGNGSNITLHADNGYA